MTCADAARALAVLALCAGCAASDAPGGPRPAAMLPAAGLATAETAVEIVGEGFLARGVQDADGDSSVDAGYRAWLGGTELREVSWIDGHRLRAVVPAGLAIGWHDLAVQGPFGMGTLANAFLVRAQVEVVAEDPFADGSPFAFVTGYRGQVYAGPNRYGTGIVRLAPDGSALESLSLSFSRDAAGNSSSNSRFPYASIGFTGCSTNSLVNACGPDNEDGRGFLTSASFAGDEWLVLGGARSGGDLEYVYLSRSASAPLDFSYVDLSAALGANTRGFSAAIAAGERLYLGFPDNGGERPYGLALLAPPPTPGGLDALNTHVVNFNLHDAYNTAYGKFASISMVDAIAELGGRLYFFNDIGCLAARSLTPATRDDFTACSPAEGPAYALVDSIEPTRQYDLEPRDRAWPAAVAWRGRLYAIRNTYAGPQLWRCDPAAGTDPAACDRADWSLVAGDAGQLTRFGRASLLIATATELWIGFDGAVGGIALFRTSVDAPAVASDFRGKDGCAAGAPGCEGVGGDGFGAPATFSRIFDAEAIDWGGGTDLFLAAGNGAGPVRIVRVAP